MAHHDLWGRPSPETDEEYLEYYQDRISLTQSRQLLPLQEDLADWINKTLGIEYMNATNLLDMLDNGVILCHLAKLIQNRIQEAVDDGTEPGPVPIMKGRCFENAARRSFFSRDNMDRFIQFCRQLGVHQNLLFESEDLVLQNNPRSVILCLMEVARLASRYNIEPPGLVALEKEIAEEESHDSGLSLVSWQFQGTGTISKPSRHSGSDSRRGLGDSGAGGDDGGLVGGGGASDGVPSDTTEDDWSRGSGEDPDLLDITDHSGIINTPARGDAGMSDLDRKVQHATRAAQRHCHCRADKCDKLRVKKVGEGRYNIAGRNVFVRLLKGRHMMVRVGGGWDTLDHFLQRHDPCQIKARCCTNKASGPNEAPPHPPKAPCQTPESVKDNKPKKRKLDLTRSQTIVKTNQADSEQLQELSEMTENTITSTMDISESTITTDLKKDNEKVSLKKIDPLILLCSVYLFLHVVTKHMQ
ncbi:growth arrest-specific protein 2 [Nilaparvata lugens]|uniref:growth arrest-specific protein 2 n=1 Tax=Nilaparvata lugens TaxID=108931 RepID=UPI00193DFB41|nr:growth arrest-specific protein 2 [Nilaparvata lugens]